MATTVRERKVIFDAGNDVTLPDLLTASAAVSRVAEQDRVELVSTYFDTAELDLMADAITLRHRQGPVDTGWQLKLPDRDARLELATSANAADSARLPVQLRDLLSGARLGRALERVATVRIRRDVQQLLADSGAVLATISDDTVQATARGRADLVGWREIEVELGDAGDEALLTTIGARLIRAGAQPSTGQSKLARVLSPSTGARRQNEATAGRVVVDYIDTQRRTIVLADVALRNGEDSTQSAARAARAVRRSRSVLHVFGALFDDHRRAELDGQLAWYAGLLADVRSCRVQNARLDDAIAALPTEQVMGAVANEIDERLATERQLHHASLLRAMAGRRYRVLLRELSRWCAQAPVTDEAADSPRALSGLLDVAMDLVDEELRHAARGDEPAFDRARVAADRATDACELVRATTGRTVAKASLRGCKRTGRLLRKRSDALANAEVLRRLAASSATTTFTYGVLFAAEHQRADRAGARALSPVSHRRD